MSAQRPCNLALIFKCFFTTVYINGSIHLAKFLNAWSTQCTRRCIVHLTASDHVSCSLPSFFYKTRSLLLDQLSIVFRISCGIKQRQLGNFCLYKCDPMSCSCMIYSLCIFFTSLISDMSVGQSANLIKDELSIVIWNFLHRTRILVRQISASKSSTLITPSSTLFSYKFIYLLFSIPKRGDIP
jgi:hypothetical protein